MDVGADGASRSDQDPDLVARLQTLVDANLALSQELRPDVLLQTLVDLARRVGGARYAALGVLDEDASGLSEFVHSGMEPDVVEQIGDLPEGRGVLGTVVTTGQSLRLDDLALHADSVGFPEHHPPMRAFLGVPVEFHGEIFGNLYLTDKVDGGSFSEEDQLVVSALAAQAAVAIHNARAYDRESQLVEDLRRLDGARSEFVSTVSHELRSPVTALSGLAQTLQRHRALLSDDEVEQSIGAIARQAARLNRLVDQLLDLSRIESSQFDVARSRFLLAPVVLHALDGFLEPDAGTVAVSIPDDLDVLADPGRLDQVLVNLIGNAIRHGGPSVEVRGQRIGDEVELVVTDDGDGVPAGVEDRLFERFARGKDPGGSGLGLAISAALVAAMHGTLRYERVEDRTRFVVCLPAGSVAEGAVERATDPDGPGPEVTNRTDPGSQ